MYLEKFIGKQVSIDLTEEAKDLLVMDMFYETKKYRENSLIMSKLVAVDEIGLWIEGFKSGTILADEEGNKLPEDKQVTKEFTTHVLIPWSYISGIFIIEDENMGKFKIGFEEPKEVAKVEIMDRGKLGF